MSWILLLLTSLSAFAYIPEYGMLASRAADQHGKGTYWIEQDVTFRRDAESYTVKESWLVANEGAMRVTLEGRGPLKGQVQGSVIFEGGQKHFIDGNSQGVRTQRLGDEWLEPLFHFRWSKYLRNRLVTLHITPPESVHDRPAFNLEGGEKYQPPGFIRLSRVGGAIAWAIGAPPVSGVQPTLWLEQDQFLLRKLRTTSQVILHANDYAKFDEGFMYPRQRIYNFGKYTVEIQTLRVKSLGKLKADDKSFKSSNLVPAKDGLRLPEADGLKEFYARFR